MAEAGGGRGRMLLGAGLLLSLTLAAGRLTGLLREMQLAASFGVSALADLAVLLLTLPDLLVNLLLSGGLGAALVPRLRGLPAPEAAALFRRTLGLATIAFSLAAVAIVAWPAGVFSILAPGLAGTDLSDHRFALAAVALAMPLTAAAGVTSAHLNAHHRFFVAGCGTLVFNLCIVASLVLASPRLDLPLALGVGIASGAVVRLVSQLAAVPRADWSIGASSGPIDRQFVHSFVAATAAASLMLLVPVAVRAMASLTGSGAIASFNYATKLVELPVGILISAAGTVALTRLSEAHALGDGAAMRQQTTLSLQRTFLLAVSVALPSIAFADAAVTALLLRGQMGAQAVERVTALARIALAGIPFLALSVIAAAALNAQGRSATVLRATGWAVLLLPILAAPGLAMGAERWLMAAVVVFQMSHAALLLRASGLPSWGKGGWLSPKIAAQVAAVGVVTLAAAAIARFFAVDNVWWRLALAVAVFAAAATWLLRESTAGPLSRRGDA